MTTELKKDEKIPPIEIDNSHVDDGGSQTERDISAAPDSGADDQQQRQETKIVPIGDGGRAAIAERFKAKREDKEKPVEASGDYTDPAQTYGTVAQVEVPVVTDTTDAQPQEKFKLKVRGEEREVDRTEAVRLAKVVTGNDDTEGLSDDHLARLAQIGAAGQSYLEDTRQVLETTRTRVQVSRQHPDDALPAPTATETNDQDDDGTTPADPVKALVNEIQYGDPDQAAEKLRSTMRTVAVDAVKEANSDTRVQDDIRADLRAHDEFVEKHADLASDPIATAVIREGLMTGYRDDLRKIGVPEDKIPTDPTVLANHHRHYKLAGQPVRSVATLLEDSAEKLTKWRGGKSQTEDPNPKPQQQERTVRVDVNRDDRRRAIPQQPTRANVQPQLNNTQPTGQKSRSDAVQAAKRARGQV